MDKHNYIYLGRERGKQVVHKVGQTSQTCWARCCHADYLIGVAVELKITTTNKRKRKDQLNMAEEWIIRYFSERFPTEHGREYFRTKGHRWDVIKEMFLTEMTDYLDEMGWDYEIHDGWVAPNTY